MTPMNPRERMLALIQGRPQDLVPFACYDGLVAPRDQLWQHLGRANVGLIRWTGLVAEDRPHCRVQEEKFDRDGRVVFKHTLHTPAGTLFEERYQEPTYGTTSAGCHYVKEPADYAVLLSYLRDASLRLNTDGFVQVVHDLGQDGLPHTATRRSPFQQLWIEWVSIEDLCLHMVDCPEVMEEVFAALFDVQRRTFELYGEAARGMDIPYIVIPDNITAPIIGELYFRKYCVPSYRLMVDLLAETGRDIPVFVHMDGHLRPLWAAIADSGIRGLDSLSPPPDNDTSAADVGRLWPQMRMGLNFPSSVHLRSPREVYAKAREILDQAGHSGRLQFQISENVPPGLWKTTLPQIVQAINDFGAP